MRRTLCEGQIFTAYACQCSCHGDATRTITFILVAAAHFFATTTSRNGRHIKLSEESQFEESDLFPLSPTFLDLT